ncbi:hypothetical protein CBR_g12264 [Chara braunii]|uniref:Uncharacterized protein n=1 Tax=Chara braunii TaxID=69332 RepID=A0A388KRM7_CHABU|nr:hypothetical protein CBR_g12264 [Chara braunii]|eukprot:GBG72696.1 hypothetical protein CBR_g12264 [Chara braunii]
MLTCLQTAGMDQKSGETDKAYQARMLLLITEAKQRSDAVAAAAKKKAEDAEKAYLLAIEQQRQQDEAAAKAANEERIQRHEKIFSGERALLTMAADWRAEAENGKWKRVKTRSLYSSPISRTSWQHALHSRRTSTTTRCLKSTAASTCWSSAPLPPPMPALPTPPIASRHWRLTSDPSRTYGVVAADLHTKINWDDLKAAWHKRFRVELSKIKAMDKPMTFEQGTLPSVDWIAEYQHLTSVPDIQMGFKAIKHYFISRSCPTLGNALTHVEDTLTTPAELFDKAVQIIVTNKVAKNLHHSSATGPSIDQHRPKVVVVAAATPNEQTSEAVSAHEGDRLAAARDGGRPGKGRGRGKAKTNTASSPGPGAVAPAPWSHYGLSEQAYKTRT